MLVLRPDASIFSPAIQAPYSWGTGCTGSPSTRVAPRRFSQNWYWPGAGWLMVSNTMLQGASRAVSPSTERIRVILGEPSELNTMAWTLRYSGLVAGGLFSQVLS